MKSTVFTTSVFTASISAVALAAALGAAPVSAENIGSVAALNQNVDGTPPGTETRKLIISDALFLDELIESSPIGSGQFLFLDQTSLTIAKNSILTLDKYVYDPSTKTGEFAINMSRGVLRFVGGRITKQTDAIVRTPTATIGIRGGMAIIIVDENGATRVMHIAGEYTRVTTNEGGAEGEEGGETITISRSNGVVEVTPAGGAFIGVDGSASPDGSTTGGGSTAGGGSTPGGSTAGGATATGPGTPSPSGDGQTAGGDRTASGGGAKIVYLGRATPEFVRQTGTILIGRGEAGERVDPQNPDVIESGVPSVNSEAKSVTTSAPISTKGESAKRNEREEEDAVRVTQNEEEITSTIAETALPPDNPFADLVLLEGVTGSASFSGSGITNLTSGGGGQTFVFSQVFEGSRVGVTAGGDAFVIPTAPGFFSFEASVEGSEGGASPLGGISGGGFFDPDAEFTYAVFQTADETAGAFLSGSQSGALPDAAGGVSAQVDVRAYSVSADLFTGSNVPFTPLALGEFGGSGADDLFLISNPGGAATGANAQAGLAYLSINGSGAGQTSGFGVLTAGVEASESGAPAFTGGFEGSFSDVGALQRVFTPVATVQDGRGGSAFGEGAQYFALSNSRDLGAEAVTPGRLFAEDGTQTLFGTNNVAALQTTDSFPNAGRTPISDGDVGGYAATTGLALETGQVYAGRSSTDFGVSASFDAATNGAGMTLRLDDVFTPGLVEADLFALSTRFGDGGGRTAFLDDRNFALRNSRDGSEIDANFTNGLGGAAIDGGQNEFSGALATASLAGDGGIFPQGAARSEFLTWGWWAGEFRHDPNAQAIDSTPLRSDQRLHLGAWVAGDLTGSANLPAQGVASYQGFAVVSAVDNGVAFTDGGGFALEYDFGDGVGTASFTDILGADAQIAVDRSTFGSDYTGVAGINIGGREGIIAVDGSFFNGADPADATAGSIGLGTIDGTLAAAGVFGGDRVVPDRPAGGQ